MAALEDVVTVTAATYDEESDLIVSSIGDYNNTDIGSSELSEVMIGDQLLIVVIIYALLCLVVTLFVLVRQKRIKEALEGQHHMLLDDESIPKEKVKKTKIHHAGPVNEIFTETDLDEENLNKSIELMSLVCKQQIRAFHHPALVHNKDAPTESGVVLLAENVDIVWQTESPLSGNRKSIINWLIPDSESIKLLKLTTSLTARGAINPGTNLALAYVIKSSQMGDETLAAFLASKLIVNVSSSFICECIIVAQYTYVSQAVGEKNFYLAGRLVNITAFLVGLITFLVLMPFWYFFMEDILRSFFGLDAEVAQIGQKYTHVYGIAYMLSTIQQTYMTLLDVDNHEDFNASMYACKSIALLLVTGALWFFVKEELDLYMLGLLELFCGVLFFAIHVIYPMRKQWISPYWDGMVARWTDADLIHVKTLLLNGFTVSIGSTVAHFEWQIVSIFATTCEPKEVAAFFLIGTIWDMFYAISSGIGGASQIRVAKLLSQGNPEKAREAAFRSIWIVGILTGIGAIVGGLVRGFISNWFAKDEETIAVIYDTLPIVFFGNFADGFGSVAGFIVQGQGRFRLSTTATVAQTLLVAVPLSALMTYTLDFGVQGIACALVVGYLTAGAFVLTQVFSSEWELYARQCEPAEEDTVSSEAFSLSCDGISSCEEKKATASSLAQ